MNQNIYEKIQVGHVINGPKMTVTKEMIRDFAEASREK